MKPLQTLFHSGVMTGLSDAELLEWFTTRDAEAAEAAFAMLVERHGPMVFRVCRETLRHEHEAHDAFQAVFLILARKAGSIRRRGSVGPWLHGVALRVAACARSASARRRTHERKRAEMAANSFRETHEDDTGAVLHEEIDRLPRKYREPVVLCYLEGRTHEEAARLLNWPVGSVHSRLLWARERLRSRLTRRGLAPMPGRLDTLTDPDTAAVAVPVVLIAPTIKAACLIAAGKAAAGLVSTRAAELMGRGLRTMFLAQLKPVIPALLAAGALTIGSWGLATGTTEARQQAPPQEPPARPRNARETEEAARARSATNLRNLTFALNEFSEVNGFLPPAAIRDPNTKKPLLSWRVAILPWIGAKELYEQFHLGEPWDSPHNKLLLEKMPEVFASTGTKAAEPFSTFYKVFVGPGTVFEPMPGEQKLTMTSVIDGAANTVAIVEAADAVPWTKPEDLIYAADRPLTGLREGDFLAAFLDASVRTLQRPADRNAFEALMKARITRNGGGGDSAEGENPPK